MNLERRRESRRQFHYYLKVMEEGSMKLIGHMTDINHIGFKVDSALKIAPGTDVRLRMDLPNDISPKGYLALVARVKWCKADDFSPNLMNIGFEVVRMNPSDATTYNLIVQKYAG
jgi:hypothetical protein